MSHCESGDEVVVVEPRDHQGSERTGFFLPDFPSFLIFRG